MRTIKLKTPLPPDTDPSHPLEYIIVLAAVDLRLLQHAVKQSDFGTRFALLKQLKPKEE